VCELQEMIRLLSASALSTEAAGAWQEASTMFAFRDWVTSLFSGRRRLDGLLSLTIIDRLLISSADRSPVME
jgi:hypothetical protein